MMHAIAVILLLALMVSTNAFVSTPSPLKHISQSLKPSRKMELQMGGKMSKFGIFSPAVYAAKLVLGEKKLEKVRKLII